MPRLPKQTLQYQGYQSTHIDADVTRNDVKVTKAHIRIHSHHSKQNAKVTKAQTSMSPPKHAHMSKANKAEYLLSKSPNKWNVKIIKANSKSRSTKHPK